MAYFVRFGETVAEGGKRVGPATEGATLPFWLSPFWACFLPPKRREPHEMGQGKYLGIIMRTHLNGSAMAAMMVYPKGS